MIATIDRDALIGVLRGPVAHLDDGKAKPAGAWLRLSLADSALIAESPSILACSGRSAPLVCDVEREGEVIVAGARLLSLLSAMPRGEVKISAKKSHLELSAGRLHYRVPLLDVAGEWPPAADGDAVEGLGVEVSAQALAGLIAATGYAVSPGDNRFGLNGLNVEMINYEGEATVLRAAATDGSRMAIASIPAAGSLGLGKQLIPTGGLKALRAFCGDAGDGSISVSALMGGRALRAVSAAGACLVMRLVDGEFPQYQHVLPARVARSVRVDRSALIAAVKHVSPMATDRNLSIRIDVAEGEMTISAAGVGSAGMASEAIDCDLTGSPISTAFNASFLTECLGSLAAAQVALHLGEALDPVVIRPADEVATDYGPAARFGLVMPMRLD